VIEFINVKPLIDGDFKGEAVIIDNYISFYGEVDPVNGVHKPSGKSIAGKVLVFKGGRGSTVGSYVIYALKKNGRNPCALIVEKAEPIIVTGAVLADIPLMILIDRLEDVITRIRDNVVLIHKRGENIVWIV